MSAASEDPVLAGEVDITSMQLGIDRHILSVQSREEVRSVVQSQVKQAQRSLMLFTFDLEPAIFDQQPFLAAINTLARKHHNTSIRVLIFDSRRALQGGHRMIELSRRLSANIRFRRPPPDCLYAGKTYLVVDDSGYCYRPLASRYEGTACFNNPGVVARLKKDFLEIWEKSESDSELRLLHV